MINIASLLFYILSTVLLTSATLVITSRNTVHGVLFLILTFFNAAGLFILANAEFLAMMLIIVYVGAVAVLFLFVVMMLNIDLVQVRKVAKQYLLTGGLVGAVLIVELLLMLYNWKAAPAASEFATASFSQYKGMPNTQALGNLLYTHYALIFQSAGIILLIAMMGAIVLTHRQREGVRKQKISEQLARDMRESVELVDVPSGKGI